MVEIEHSFRYRGRAPVASTSTLPTRQSQSSSGEAASRANSVAYQFPHLPIRRPVDSSGAESGITAVRRSPTDDGLRQSHLPIGKTHDKARSNSKTAKGTSSATSLLGRSSDFLEGIPRDGWLDGGEVPYGLCVAYRDQSIAQVSAPLMLL
jgi:hypothetical protein